MLLQRQNEALLKRLRVADGALEENRQLKQQLQQMVRRRPIPDLPVCPRICDMLPLGDWDVWGEEAGHPGDRD